MNQIRMKRLNRKPLILAVFAHPDDESFLVGGTLAHYAGSGVEVKLLCLTQGESGYNAQMNEQERLSLPRVRQAELARSCEVLGAQLLPMLDFPDGRLREVSTLKLAQPIAQAIRQQQPDIVLTFGRDGLTGHPDHVAIHRATSFAFQNAAMRGSALFYASLAENTVLRLSTRLEGSFNNFPLRLTGVPMTQLDTAIRIDHTSDLKWAAIECHRSQAGNFDSLTPADLALLSKSEYFRLANIAGDYAFNRYPSSVAAPLSADLFDTISRRYQLSRTA
jgi:LmbE family N-acetylglucosaminyl deacetylase